MISYSFMGGCSESSKADAKKLLETTDKQILYTNGLRYRNPTTMDVPIDKDKALDVFNRDFCDVKECEDYVLLNSYDSNDLW